MGCATATGIGTVLVGGRACVGCGNMSGAGRSEARARLRRGSSCHRIAEHELRACNGARIDAAHWGNVMRAQWWEARMATTSGMVQSDA
eukprot:6213646-Pleurochrysis_carterae.AAC.2